MARFARETGTGLMGITMVRGPKIQIKAVISAFNASWYVVNLLPLMISLLVLLPEAAVLTPFVPVPPPPLQFLFESIPSAFFWKVHKSNLFSF